MSASSQLPSWKLSFVSQLQAQNASTKCVENLVKTIRNMHVTAASSNNAELEKKVQDLQADLFILTRDKAQVIESMLLVTEELQSAEKIIEDKNQQIQRLEDENKRINEEIRTHKVESDQLLVEIQRRDMEIAQQDEYNIELEKTLQETKTQMTADTNRYVERLKQLEATVEHLNNSLHQQEQIIKQLQQNNNKRSSSAFNFFTLLKPPTAPASPTTGVSSPSSNSTTTSPTADLFPPKRGSFSEPANNARRNSTTSHPNNAFSQPIIQPASSLDGNPTMQITKMIQAHPAPVNSIAYNHQGSLFATGSDDKTIKLWDPSTGRLHSQLSGSNGSICNISFSRSEEYILGTGSDSSVKIWNVNQGSIVASLKGHSETCFAGDFSPADQTKLLTGSNDKTIKIWDIPQQQCIKTYTCASTCNDLESCGGRSFINTEFGSAPSDMFGIFASGHFDTSVRLWDLRSEKNIAHLVKIHSQAVTSVCFSNDGRFLLTNSRDNSLAVLDLKTYKILLRLGSKSYVNSLSYTRARFSPCSKFISVGSYNGNILTWNLMNSFEDVLQAASAIVVSPQAVPASTPVSVTSPSSPPSSPFPTASSELDFSRINASVIEQTHTDAVTCTAWNDERQLLTCSKDGKVVMLAYQDGKETK